MKYKNLLPIIIATLVFLAGCELSNSVKMEQPVAKKIPKELVANDDTRIDNYYWLNERENPEVVAYLNEENAYTKAMMQSTEQLQKDIYNEIVGRIKQTDESVPYTYNGYTYYTRYEEGNEYPLYCRKKNSEDAFEEIFLNGNKLSEGHPYFQIGGWDFSTNNEILAYSTDTVSRRKYDIYFLNIVTGKKYDEVISNTTGNIVWGNDNKTVFYQQRDETLRSYRIYKHKVGTSAKDDMLVYEEADPIFSASIYKSKSGKYLVVESSSTLTTECQILEADNPDGNFRIFQPRVTGVEYDISHQNGRWLVRTNLEATNFRLMETSEEKTGMDNWKDVIAGNDQVLIEGVDSFKDFYVVTERKNGLINFRIVNTKANTHYYLEFDEGDYYAVTSSNPDYTSELLRYSYTSLKTPITVYDYNMVSKQRELKKQQEVLGGYNPEDYVTERIYAIARDGVKVPISIVYKKGYKKDGNSPLLLYGYGSYGYSIESTFRSSRLSLLDRGFAFAIAHIRGGEEMGRQWYEDGKMLKKKNTFFDFIDCALYLDSLNYTNPDKLFAMGGSAGGLLVGAVINYRPDLFKGVIAAVPFVDVVTTMLDETIPLTTGEYDEWGNPNEKEYYNYMLSYSPYDQVEAKDYPALLVTTGLHDSQVQYWEPAKWVAKLRDMKTDDNLLLLQTNMDFGHGGASGRFEQYKETALEYAFMLMLLNENQ